MGLDLPFFGKNVTDWVAMTSASLSLKECMQYVAKRIYLPNEN